MGSFVLSTDITRFKILPCASPRRYFTILLFYLDEYEGGAPTRDVRLETLRLQALTTFVAYVPPTFCSHTPQRVHFLSPV